MCTHVWIHLNIPAVNHTLSMPGYDNQIPGLVVENSHKPLGCSTLCCQNYERGQALPIVIECYSCHVVDMCVRLFWCLDDTAFESSIISRRPTPIIQYLAVALTFCTHCALFRKHVQPRALACICTTPATSEAASHRHSCWLHQLLIGATIKLSSATASYEPLHPVRSGTGFSCKTWTDLLWQPLIL